MSGIEWDECLSIGNSEIDAQHKKWIDILNRTHEQMLSEDADIHLKRIGIAALRDMRQYCAFHFEFEEKWMAEIGFSDIRRHQDIHRAFQAHLVQLEDKVHRNPHTAATDILRTIGEWLVNHIMNEDSQIGFAQLKNKSNPPLKIPF